MTSLCRYTPGSIGTHRSGTLRITWRVLSIPPDTASISWAWVQPRSCASRWRHTGQTWENHRDDPSRLNSDMAATAWYHSITKLWHDHDDHTPNGLFV